MRAIRVPGRGNSVALLLTAALCAVLIGGCGGRAERVPDQITLDVHASGDGQAAAPGELLPRPLRVVVEGPQEPGLLGGKGTRHALPDVPVTFEIVNEESGAVFADTGKTESVILTDAGGMASAQVKLGAALGDVNIRATVATPDGSKTARFRVLSGVEFVGGDLEAPTGATLDEFGVRLIDPQGNPIPGIDVYFRVEAGGDGAKVGSNLVTTNEDGLAVTSWRLGKSTQRYFASVEILDAREDVAPDQRYHARAIEFSAMAINKNVLLLQLLGSLAVFILGMKWMSDGLQRMAGRQLKSILQSMTRNRFLAVLVGMTITAIIQASGATTVMAVGFVNAGLMTFVQSIGVIFGANIGTTVTAQIIAFKIDLIAYPAIASGLILTMVTKRAAVRALGEAILGFGLLFMGMNNMSGVLEPLRHSPQFQSLFLMFDCTPVDGWMPAGRVLMCILIGTAATVVIQSSSATVGLVMALGGQGLLSFYTAVPLVLGDNIGTTITAVLASLGANRNAKRTALVHALFNIFGTVYMFVLFYIPLWDGKPLFLGFVGWITPGDVFAAMPENLPRHIANAHTFFNLFNVALFLPFVNQLAAFVRLIIPVTDADREDVLKYLEPKLLQLPSVALQQAVKEVAYMVDQSRKSLNQGCEYFLGGPRELAVKVSQREQLIDRLQHEITAYLVDLSRQQLSASEAALIPALIHAVNDAERIGDHSENLLELADLRRQNKHKLTKAANAEIKRVLGLLNDQFEATYRALVEADSVQVERCLDLEDQINDFIKQVNDTHAQRLEEGKCDVQSGVVFLDLMAHLERVGDHLTNIAERAENITATTAA